ncbi:MAG TPA: glycosyl hydrolase family 28-related protein, partial [Tepidisphaeraceae bacterium]|nr:glycosyl hydrolase family 28-related protein [Tepidisphaeraceae bacterium]
MLLSLVALAATADQPSKLYPPADPALAGRLPDFSFAGYRRGEAPIPSPAVTANVRDFGAKGDGTTDDTAAFRAAIDKTDAGAILIPAGRYLLTDVIDVRKPNLVLRGAGPDKTTLYFPKELEDVRPNPGQTTSGRPTSNYSWSGGFVWVRGDYGSKDLAAVAAPAKRGQRTLAVSNVDGLKLGQTIEIRQTDEPTNTLADHLYAGQADDTSKLLGRSRASLTTRLTAIDAAARTITFDRALRFDVELRWKPRVLTFAPTVTGVGIESLRFEFPRKPYLGHFTERGHNAISLTQVADCWMRDVTIDDCDSGIFARGRYCTLENVTIRSGRTP